MKILKLNSRGDTVVEVLLSIAVLSLVLVISYGLANRSTQTNIAARERSEAQKYSERQLELLRAYVSPDQEWASGVNADICFNDLAEVTKDRNECTGLGTDDRYNMNITYVGDATVGYVYTIRTTWENLKGSTDELKLSYKLPATGGIADSGPATEDPECSNFRDDDGDGAIDFPDDSGCSSASDNKEAVTPQVRVTVRKIAPGPGNTTPSCSSTSYQNKSGVNVNISDPDTDFDKFTNGSSVALFDDDLNLKENSNYQVRVYAPANYTNCPPSRQTVTTGSNDSTVNREFKIRPNCYTRNVFDSWHWHSDVRDEGSWHDHGYWATWWQHTNSGGYWGRAPYFYRDGHQQWEYSAGNPSPPGNGVYARYAYPSGTGANRDWRNHFVWRAVWVSRGHWHPYYVDRGSWHEHRRNENICYP